MTMYEHLPIYKKAMELAVYIETIVRGFSRYHKYSLGSELRTYSHKVLILVSRANSQQDKQARFETLTELRETLEAVKMCLRLGKETKAFNNLKSFVNGIEQVAALSRQTEGWIKFTHKTRNVSLECVKIPWCTCTAQVA